MKWFVTVFLPSLEERYNQRGGKLWLTAKQVDVCRRYMEYGALRGQMHFDFGDKSYRIQIAKNGCGHFTIMVNGWTVSKT